MTDNLNTIISERSGPVQRVVEASRTLYYPGDVDMIEQRLNLLKLS